MLSRACCKTGLLAFASSRSIHLRVSAPFVMRVTPPPPSDANANIRGLKSYNNRTP